MIKIINIEYRTDYIIKLTFSDDTVKYLNFAEIIQFKGIAEQLKDIDYFKTVRIINNGRAFGWDNDYDCCADWARYYI